MYEVTRIFAASGRMQTEQRGFDSHDDAAEWIRQYLRRKVDAGLTEHDRLEIRETREES